MKGPDRLARAAEPPCGCHASALVIPSALVAAATVDLRISRLSMQSLQKGVFGTSIDDALNSDNYQRCNERLSTLCRTVCADSGEPVRSLAENARVLRASSSPRSHESDHALTA